MLSKKSLREESLMPQFLSKSVEKSFSACGISFSSSEDFKAQIKKALNFSDEHGISLLVTGSFYLVSEVKKILSEF